MIIDVKPKDLGLPTEAYISVEEIHDVGDPSENRSPHWPTYIDMTNFHDLWTNIFVAFQIWDGTIFNPGSYFCCLSVWELQQTLAVPLSVYTALPEGILIWIMVQEC